MADMKMTDHQHCRTWNFRQDIKRKAWNSRTWKCRTWNCRTKKRKCSFSLFFKHVMLWCTLRKWLFIKKRPYNVARYKQIVGDGAAAEKNEPKNIKSRTVTEVIYCNCGATSSLMKGVDWKWRTWKWHACVCSETAASVYGSTVEIPRSEQ